MAAAWTDGGLGSFIIDRRFRGVGRLKLASGTRDKPTFRALNAMLSAIADLGRTDVLTDLRDRVYPPLLVLDHWRRGALDELPTRAGLAKLAPALEHFRATHDVAESTRADLATAIRHVTRVGGPDAVVADLASIVRALKDEMRETATPVAFNRTRSYLLAFARSVTGKHSPLWLAIARVDAFNAKQRDRLAAAPRDGQTRRVQLVRRPLTVAELDAVCEAFRDVPVYGGKRGQKGTGEKTLKRTIAAADLAAMVRTLATTGMRPQEYWERDDARWTDRETHIWVAGTKTRAATRPTFRLEPPARPACGETIFRREFAAACERAIREGLDTYSLRRTFASWCELAGVPASRWHTYQGHGPKTVSDLYLQTNVVPFVTVDAATVAGWLEQQRGEGRRGEIRLVSHDISHG